MNPLKLLVVLVWLLLAGSFLLPPDSTYASLGRLGFFLMAGAHVVEFLFYLPFLRTAPGSLVRHFANVLVFGFLYYQELRAAGEPPAA